MVFVTYTDIVNAAVGLTVTASEAAVDRLITKAIEQLRHEFPTLEQRIASGELSEDLVIGVVEDMVVRVLRNPSGKRRESIDDYSYEIDRALSAGELYISARERALLGVKTKARGIRSMRLAVPRWRVPGA